jgi:TPP-dependent trihydroxycyclohexane-1,2-dione (THcHDO) dehydratase
MKNFVQHLSSLRSYLVALTVTMLGCAVLAGCSKPDPSVAALESDVNGYVCPDCKSKFYTDRKVFPTRCPDCKKQNIQEAIGYVCSADKQMTIEGRNVRSVKCRQCAAALNQIYMPQKVDLNAWGATLKTEAQVTGQ